MFFSKITYVLAPLVGMALGQAANTHNIMVGMGGLTFTPSNITAAPGDVVMFTFAAKNHSATQSSFAAPCTQINNQSVTPPIIGISSGFQAVPAGSATLPTWAFQVTDTTPLWFFCLQANHCQQGMVFSVNETPAKSFAAFQTAAMETTQSVAAPETGGAQTPSGGGSSQSAGAPGQTGAGTGTGAGAGTPTAGGTSPSAPVASPNGSPISSGSSSPSPSGAASMVGVSSSLPAFLALVGLSFTFGL